MESITLQEQKQNPQTQTQENIQEIEEQILNAVISAKKPPSKIQSGTPENQTTTRKRRRSFLLSKIPIDVDSPKRVISRTYIALTSPRGDQKEKLNQQPVLRCKTTPNRKTVNSVHCDTQIPIEPMDTSDPDLVFDETGIILGGTPRKLLELITNISLQDFFYITQFLSVYKYFMTTEEVLEYLIKYYHTEPTSYKSESEKQQRKWLQRQRVLYIITKWIKNHKEDFFGNQILCNKLRTLLQEINEPAATETFTKCLTHFNVPPPAPHEEEIEGVFLCKYEAKHLAQQLALVDQQLFCKITAKELREQNWVKTNSDLLSPTITRCIRHFNKISYWIATEILKGYSVPERVRTLEHAIKVADESFQLRNYNTAMAIVCGLSLSSISRLKESWKGLNSEIKSTFCTMEELFTSNSNYAKLRELLSNQHPPMIPYLGVYLKDLVFIDVGNPSFLDTANRCINFDKLRMISAIITELQAFQGIPYSYREDASAQHYIHCSASPYDEEQLYKISRIVEPVDEPELPRTGSSIIKRVCAVSKSHMKK